MAIVRIQDIAQHIGEQVTLQGWLYNKTDKGKLDFLQVRDGTGIVQAVVFQKDVSPETFAAAQRPRLNRRSSSPALCGKTGAHPVSPADSNWASRICRLSRW